MVKIFRFDGKYPVDVRRKNEEGWSLSAYVMGKPLEKNNIILNCELFSKKNIIPDAFETGNFDIVSEKFKHLLSEYARGCLEFKEVSVQNKEIKERYFLLNVLTKCDCIDFSKSEVELFKGQVDHIEHLVLDYDKVTNDPIFLVDKSFVRLICFQQDLVNIISNSHFIGFDFIEPEDYWM